MVVREDDYLLLPLTSFFLGDYPRHHGRGKGRETRPNAIRLSVGVAACLIFLLLFNFNLFSSPDFCDNGHIKKKSGGGTASISPLRSTSLPLLSAVMMPNIAIVTFAEATPKRHRNGGARGAVVGASPAPFTVPPYSLSSACADEIKKWCLYRTPFTQEAINCFESHRSELSHDCLRWHDARLSCQSQIHERASSAANAGEEKEEAEEDKAGGGKREDRGVDHRNGNAGGGGGLGGSDWENGGRRGLVATQPNQPNQQQKSKKSCDDICKKFCGEGKSLMLCMRVMGKSLRNVVDESCYNSEFAKSIVRSLNSKIN